MKRFQSAPVSGAPGIADFLAGGGELGAMMRARDWSDSPLGLPEQWPTALKSTVAMMLPAAVQIVLFWGPEFVALYNDSYAPTIGDKHPRALGRPARENWSELWDDLEPLLRRVLDKGETVSAEDRPFYIERHGHPETVYFDISYSPVRDEAGAVGGVLCIVKETTRKVLADQLLRESEERFRAMADSAPMPTWVTGEGGIEFANRALGEFFGLSGEELSGDAWTRLIHPDDLAAVAAARAQAWEKKEPYRFEARFRSASGEWRWMHVGSRPRFDADGALIGYVGMAADLTEVRRAEAELRESEVRFHGMADSIDQMIWSTRPDGFHDYFNQRWYDYTGVPEGSTDGEAWNGMFHPDDQEHAWQVWRRCLETGEPYHIEYRLRHRSGAYRWVLGRAQPVRDEGGAIVRWYGTCTDIHDLKEAQERVRQSEEGFRAMVESLPIPAWVTAQGGGIAFANRAFSDFAGLPPEKLLQEGWKNLVHPDDLVEYVRVRDAALSGSDPFDIEVRARRSDGSWRRMRVSARPRVGTAGDFGYVGVATDLTEIRETEHALRESEKRFRNMADHAPVMMWVTDQNGHCSYLNRAWYDFTGQSEAEAEGFGWLDATHPDDKPMAEKAFREVNARQEPFRAEYRLRRKDGTYRWAIDAASPRFGPGGEYLGYIGSVIDIDDRREIEDALRSSEDRLRLAAEAAQIGIWDFDPVSGRLDWDDRVRAAFGLSPDAHVDYDVFLAGLHPEDRERANAGVQRALDPGGSGSYDIEYRTVGVEDGKERWIAARGRAHFEGGRPVRFIGTTLDISARKEAEFALARTGAELREQAQTLETLNRSASELSGELDLQRVVQMATDNGVELTGAEFGAFFYNVTNEAGESYMLFTLSGARRDQFEFGMPRATAVFHPTFTGEGVIRSEDITADPRYGLSGPHFGMPEGHLPVRSYLAVPVVSASGEVIGGLFFGHPEPGRFSERHEALMTGIAAQAAIAMDNARLYEAAQKELASRMRAEQELRLLNETLEQRVADEVDRRAQAEEALRQAQKMETLGQLTGGVAHDFNNLLQIVSGNLDLILRALPEEEKRLRRAAENAARGSERAAVLTQRLLAFSRRQPLAPKPVDTNRLVSGMSELLHRTLGETIEVETVLASGLWPVEVDPHQLENSILNLAINARDAMPEGGKLTIETCNTHLDRGYVSQNAEATAGQYVAICVSDTGTGMDEDTVARAFEPFFTTKEVGKGTGLGLSMVYGFVKQSGGHLKIYSEPGQGTTVKIYLPRMMGERPESEEEADEIVPEGGQDETILVCEDDDDVRAYTVEVLRELGYRVLEAHDGPSALRLLERQEGRVDLLFTDVVLPGGMNGEKVAEQARAMRPDLKVLFTTGYARNAIVHHGRLDPGVELITKPFSYADLAARVRDMLDTAS